MVEGIFHQGTFCVITNLRVELRLQLYCGLRQGTGRRNKADIITYSPTVPVLSHCPLSPPTHTTGRIYWVSTGYLLGIY